ncbi:21941_t:CDS:2 [Entrophospora sp. SA101]|nr:21941_t:CDS:2 [Entrophospora sp. SA101]
MKRKGEIIVKGNSGANENFSPHTTMKKENVTRDHESTSHVDEQLIEQDDINDVVKQAINNNNLGSTIFINANQQYLTWATLH